VTINKITLNAFLLWTRSPAVARVGRPDCMHPKASVRLSTAKWKQ